MTPIFPPHWDGVTVATPADESIVYWVVRTSMGHVVYNRLRGAVLGPIDEETAIHNASQLQALHDKLEEKLP